MHRWFQFAYYAKKLRVSYSTLVLCAVRWVEESLWPLCWLVRVPASFEGNTRPGLSRDSSDPAHFSLLRHPISQWAHSFTNLIDHPGAQTSIHQSMWLTGNTWPMSITWRYREYLPVSRCMNQAYITHAHSWKRMIHAPNHALMDCIPVEKDRSRPRNILECIEELVLTPPNPGLCPSSDLWSHAPWLVPSVGGGARRFYQSVSGRPLRR